MRIRKLRERNHWSQMQLAEMLGIHNSVISKIESDKRMLDSELLTKLAEMFGITTDYMLGRTSIENDASYSLHSEYAAIASGTAPAQPIESIREHRSDYTVQQAISAGQGESCFFWPIADDSWAQQGIRKGGRLLIRMQHTVENGKIGLIASEHGGMLKRIYFADNGQIVLLSGNGTIPPLLVGESELKILGQAILYIEDL